MQDDTLLAQGEAIARAEMADKEKYQWQWGDWALEVAPSSGKGISDNRLQEFRDQLREKDLEVPTIASLLEYRRVAAAWPNPKRLGFAYSVYMVLASQADRESLLKKGMTVAKARELVNERNRVAFAAKAVNEKEEVSEVPVNLVDPEQLKDPEAARAFVAKHPAVSAALSKAIVQNPETRKVAAKEFVAQNNEVKERSEQRVRAAAPELSAEQDWLTLIGHMTSSLLQLTKAIELSKIVEITESRRNRLREVQEKIEAASDFIGSWREGQSSSLDQELQDLLNNP